MLRRVGGQSADHVSADFRLGMTSAAEHLIRLGHQRIAFVGGARRVSPARDRTRAFRETLPRFGLPVGPIVDCLPTREEGAAAVGRAVPRKDRTRPTAVLCHNDLCAFGVMVGLVDRGLTPGRDVAVIGFDNIPEGAHASAGADERRHRSPPDRRGGRQPLCSAGSRRRTARPKASSCRRSSSFVRAAAQRTVASMNAARRKTSKLKKGGTHVMKAYASQRALLAGAAIALAGIAWRLRRLSPTQCLTPRPRSLNTPARRPHGRGRPRARSRNPARRSSFCPATNRTTFRISTASTSRKPARSSAGTSPSSTAKAARLPGSPA